MDNPQNKRISKEYLQDVINCYIHKNEKNQTYVTIKNLELYQRAMTHESYYMAVMTTIGAVPDQSTGTLSDNVGKGTPGQAPGRTGQAPVYIDYIPPESSERLEFLGDSILKAVMGNYLYSRFPEEREGFLTKLKIKIEKSAMLHQFALTLGFREYILLSRQVEEQTVLGENRGRHTPSYYENAFEAFIGAMMLDLGYTIVSDFVKGVIERIIDFSDLITRNDNFKDSVQRFYQSLRFATPTYKSIVEEGPLYRRIFTRAIWIDKHHLELLSEQQQSSIKEYTKSVINGFQIRNGKIFLQLMDLVSKNYWIVGIGIGKKVINAEQEAAKEGLVTLGLPLDF
jgi:ribonuclease-3